MSQDQHAAAPADARIITVTNDETVVVVIGGALHQEPGLRIGVVCESDMQRRAISKGVVELLAKSFGGVESKGTSIYTWKAGPPRGRDPRVRFLVTNEAIVGGRIDLVIKATEQPGDPRWWRDLGHRLVKRLSNGEG